MIDELQGLERLGRLLVLAEEVGATARQMVQAIPRGGGSDQPDGAEYQPPGRDRRRDRRPGWPRWGRHAGERLLFR